VCASLGYSGRCLPFLPRYADEAAVGPRRCLVRTPNAIQLKSWIKVNAKHYRSEQSLNSNLYKIVYCSKNLIEGDDAKRDAEIEQILQTSRRNNKVQNVTGALLFDSGYFAQVLEGPKLAIEQTFERIQRDPRHGDVTVLSVQTDGHRDFPEWSMAHVASSGGTGSAGMAALALDTASLHPAASADEVLGLLRSLVIQED